MQRLFVILLFAFAAWYGWNHKEDLLHRPPANEAIVQNRSGFALERVRLSMGDQTLVAEVIESGQDARFKFRVSHDSDFKLVWQVRRRYGDRTWQGGLVTAGPLLQRHTFTLDDHDGVIWKTERITPTATR